MYSSKDNKLVTTDIDNTAKLIADGIMKFLDQAGYTIGSNLSEEHKKFLYYSTY